MLAPGFYNMDCMAGMRQFPDGYFDLAVVDPPYGSATGDADYNRFGGWFVKYAKKSGGGNETNMSGQAEHGRKNTVKKSPRGTSPREKTISMSFSASRAIKSYGAGTIFTFRRRGALLFGISAFQTILVWRPASTLGHPLTQTQSCTNASRKARRRSRASIQRKNRSNCINGF